MKNAHSIFACLALIFALLLVLGMTKRLDHDEHQFVASAALLARHGLLPYRDYAYFHMPNLLFADALMFRYCEHLLLAARALSIVCAFGTVAITFLIAHMLFAPFGRRTQWTAATMAAAVLMTQPLFVCTSGRAWNHDVPVLLTLLAFFAAMRATTSSRPARWQIAAGLLLGAAIGTRLTFAPAMLAFAMIILMPRAGVSIGRRLLGVARLGMAVAIALAPSWWLLAIAPRQFIFGNFLYPALNTEFRRESGFHRSMSMGGKVLYVFSDVLSRPASALLFVALVASVIVLARSGRRAHRPPHPHRPVIVALLLLIGCLLIGTFAPTPLFPVYFYAPLPFALLVVLYAAADERKDSLSAPRRHRLLAWGGIVAIGLGLFGYGQVLRPRDLARWVPIDVHRVGRELCRGCPPGRVLTLAPIFPLEGGMDIYEELATGPFALRAGRRLGESDERLYKLIDEEDWPELFDQRPPAAVLTGIEGGPDEALAVFARSRGYVDRLMSYRTRTVVFQTLAPDVDRQKYSIDRSR